MKVGVIVPSRGDRPQFLDNCLRMITCQTFKPSRIVVLDHEPKSDSYDITERYKTGYYLLDDVDVIACIEDDDWYSPQYLEWMFSEWVGFGKPVLIGINYTIYYHLGLRAYFTMNHERRASTMSTMIRANIDDIDWPLDHDPFPDVHLWLKNKHLSKKLFTPSEIISMGIKHGTGKCVRNSHHTGRLHRFENSDPDLKYLRSVMDDRSFEFYRSVSNDL